MVFTVDDKTGRLVASVPADGGVEAFDCVAQACSNPACRCQTLTITFRACAPDAPATAAPKPDHKAVLDIGARSIDTTFIMSATQADLGFAEALLAAMEPADFDRLAELHYRIKRYETEHAKPAEIEVQFDFNAIERSSTMQTYNDILPFAETIQVVVDGVEYVVLDQYCVKHRCGCTDAHLSLLPINDGAGALDTTSSVDVNYKTKIWERVANEPPPCDVATFRRLMEGALPDLYAKLRSRHERLCAIYAHARKSARPVVSDRISEQSVGRNDPCPCGSAKKFKKCCMGKGLSGGAARSTETTITIRR
jgi:hypothetical protein